VFKGWQDDKMTLGTLEGGGAPLLVVYDDYTRHTISFCFDSPKQVREFIEALEPFTKEREDNA
jgi:hypothetical protein